MPTLLARGMLVSVLFAHLIVVNQAAAQNRPKPGSVEARLARIERVVGSQALVELVEQVAALRAEVRRIRGQLEEQTHRFARMERQQRELYADLDRRLKAVESVSSNSAITDATTGDSADSRASDTTASTAAGASQPSPRRGSNDSTLSEQGDYQAAFDLLKGAKYEGAAAAFASFLGKYPDGRYADNAQYWLAEAHYVSRKFEQSLKEFRTLVDRFPRSAKVSGAKLKIGFIHHELGQNAEARRVLSAVIEEYPKTTVERLARDRLEQIGG